MSLLLKIAERALNRPLMVHPDKLPILLGVLEGRIPIDAPGAMLEAARKAIAEMPAEAQATMLGPNPTASRFVGSSTDEDPVTGRRTALPYRRTREGVAVIPVIGSLVNRGAWIGSSSGETSYEGLKFQIGFAADDPRTTAILLDIDSPGGEAVGAFEAADAIREASTKKPVLAIANGMMASAAYALGAAASRIIATPTSVVGSIGVVMLHADFSKKLDKDGVKPTLIHAGAHKVDGNPFEPLSKEVAADIQAEVDQFYSLFVSSVAQGRGGRINEDAIRATEARTFIGAEAVNEGLADELGTFETALADLSNARSGFSQTQRRISAMVDKKAPDATSGTEDVSVKMDAARAEGHTAGVAEGKASAEADKAAAVVTATAEGAKAGAAAERARISAITSLDEAKGREGAALSLALTSDLSADAAKAVLAQLPKASAVTGGRSSDSPIGLAVEQPGKSPGASDFLSPDEVAASVNRRK